MATPTNPLSQMAAHIAHPQTPNTHAEPESTKKGLFEVDAVLAVSVASWLKKRGKVLRPKLSDEQRKQLAECFELMDADGSGAIDADELGNAFKLLGLNVKKNEIVAMLDEVDRDGSGEVEYLEFIEIMTTTLHKLADEKEQENGASTSSQVPFALMATAYRRKRIMESLISGDKDMTAQIAQMGESKRWEEEDEKQAAQARALEQAQAKANRKANMDSIDSLISPAVAHALSHMKSGGGISRSVGGVLADDDDDGEEKELTLLVRQRTKEHLDARAATEQAMKQLPSYNNFRESPSHKMLMQPLNVPKVKLHLDGSSRSPSQHSYSRSPSRHQHSTTPHSLSRSSTGDLSLSCTSPTDAADGQRRLTSLGPVSPTSRHKESTFGRSKSAGGVLTAMASDNGRMHDEQDFAALTADLTGGIAGGSSYCDSDSGIHYVDARVHEFQLQPPQGVAQQPLLRHMASTSSGGSGVARKTGSAGTAAGASGGQLARMQSRSSAGSPQPAGAANGGPDLGLMGHATGITCNGGVLRNQGGVLCCMLTHT